MVSAFVPTLVRWLSRRALRWLYREVHFVGAERIPATGAVLLYGNHPNDLPDVLSGFFATSRPVRYIATISATVLPMAEATYRGLGVIPIMRVRDVRKMKARGVDGGTVNRDANHALSQAFANGDLVGVFPEGGVMDLPHLGTMRAGVAKMALECLDNGAKNEINIIPFGVQYESPHQLRSDVIIEVGTPMSLHDWVAGNPEPSAHHLATRMSHELQAVTRNSSDWTAAEHRDRLIAAVAAVNATTAESLFSTAARARAQLVAQAVFVAGTSAGTAPAEAVETAEAADTAAIAKALSVLTDSVHRVGGIATSARDTARVLDASSLANPQAQWPSLARMSITAVPAAIGTILHAPLFAIVMATSRRLAADRSELMAKAIVPGLHLIFLGYLILGGLFVLGFRTANWSAWWALPLTMLLPQLGDMSVAWRDALSAMRLRARVRRWSDAEIAMVHQAAEQLRTCWSHQHAADSSFSHLSSFSL